MGIRFYCPNGHKLHVKAFQAGMRGICPYCGAKVQIPLQSTRVSTKVLRAQKQHASAGAASQAESQSAQTEDGGTDGTPVSWPAVSRFSDVRPADGIQASTISGSESVPEYRSFPTPLTEEEMGISLANADHVAVPPDSSVTPTEVDVPHARATGFDDAALADVALVWYVRPPSGGQFGPATGDIMRQWLQEGRITPDTLVWREGWRDWREARHVFSSLGGAEFPQPESFSPAAERILAQHTPRPSRRSSRLILVILAVIALAAVAIAMFFFFGGFGRSA
ncbi:DUF4339 domain-containing protein [Thermopirellula anaerolimosa]